MRRLEALLRDASAGHGRLCLLHGEAGIGKTRCAQELMHGAQLGGISTFTGRAAPGAGAPVFWPFIQIVREMVRTRPELSEVGNEVLSRLVAYDHEQREPEPAPDRRAAAGRFWLLESVTRCLLQASKSAPVLLLIDDLQWADDGSLDLLAFLATEIGSARVLVIATQRPSENKADDERLARVARHAERDRADRARERRHRALHRRGLRAARSAAARSPQRCTARPRAIRCSCRRPCARS